MMARARRVDTNQAEIVTALRRLGCYVDITSSFGDGEPDLIVARPDGRAFRVEVKRPKGHMTDAQIQYIVRHVIPSYRIYTTAEDAVRGIMEAK